ncbi:unnamed protein product [Boreogadus saida]
MDPRHSDPQVPLPDLKPPQPGLQLLSPAHNEESDEPTDLSSEDTSTRAECGLTKCRGSDCGPSDPLEGSARRGLEAVSPPAPSTSPLSLPGVMDAEGRVDESRLRSHILKNGPHSSTAASLSSNSM